MKLDHAGVEAAMRHVAGNHILPRFRNLQACDVRTKSGPQDLVTIADTESEQALTRILPKLLSGSVVLGEEAYAANPQCLDLLNEDAPVWIIDPLDGTLAFTQGLETFGIIVALVKGGEILGGWILDPLGDRFLQAEKGSGVTINGNVCRVAPPAAPEAMIGMISQKYFTADIQPRLIGAQRHFKEVYTSASAAHDYLALCSARTHFALFRRVMPWDHAAGALAHAEAGGFHANLARTPYKFHELQNGILLTPDENSDKVFRGLVGPLKG